MQPRRVAGLTFRLALAASIAAGAVPLPAQGRPVLRVDLPADSLLARRGPTVRTEGMLAGDRIQRLVQAGFPARFHFRVELYSEGRFLFDDLEALAEWDVLARYLPGERTYEVLQVQDERPLSLGRFAEIADAERAVGRPYAAPIAARRMGDRQYYHVTLTVEVLSERDIDEVFRWLQGDVEPGITGRANPASILTRGFRALASRLLGGEKSEYEVTSPRFRVP